GASLLRYAAIFLVGISLATVAFQLRDAGETDPRDLAGTMVEMPRDAALVDQAMIDAPGLSGSVSLLRSASNVVLETDFRATDAAEVEIAYDPEVLDVTAIPAAAARVAGDPDETGRLVVPAGPGKHLFRFRFETRSDRGGSVDVALRSGSGESIRTTLTVPETSRGGG
ncbi:MAG: hypothetical protein P8102_13690, partial [Gammaproteobacteria bacterium]